MAYELYLRYVILSLININPINQIIKNDKVNVVIINAAIDGVIDIFFQFRFIHSINEFFKCCQRFILIFRTSIVFLTN